MTALSYLVFREGDTSVSWAWQYVCDSPSLERHSLQGTRRILNKQVHYIRYHYGRGGRLSFGHMSRSGSWVRTAFISAGFRILLRASPMFMVTVKDIMSFMTVYGRQSVFQCFLDEPALPRHRARARKGNEMPPCLYYRPACQNVPRPGIMLGHDSAQWAAVCSIVVTVSFS